MHNEEQNKILEMLYHLDASMTAARTDLAILREDMTGVKVSVGQHQVRIERLEKDLSGVQPPHEGWGGLSWFGVVAFVVEYWRNIMIVVGFVMAAIGLLFGFKGGIHGTESRGRDSLSSVSAERVELKGNSDRATVTRP